MIVKPVDVSEITQAVVDQLMRSTTMSQVTVSRSEDQNLSADQCPWVGVYRLGVQYPSRVLSGIPGARQQRVQLLLLVQASNGTSGAACENDLEALIVRVMGVLLSDMTLGGMVHMLDEFDVNYTSYMRTARNEFMQTAAIQFVAITNTTIGG